MKSKKRNPLTVTLFVIYTLLLIAVILFKLPFRGELSDGVRAVNLIPFSTMRDFFPNTLIFIPFGIYIAALSPKSSLAKKVLSAAGLSLAFELAQFLFAIGRTNIIDIISNTLGAFVGIVLYTLLRYAFRSNTIRVLNSAALIVTVCVSILFGSLFYSGYAAVGQDTAEESNAVIPITEPKEVHNSAASEASEPKTAEPEATVIKGLLLVNADNPLPDDYEPENFVSLYGQKDKHFQLMGSDMKVTETVFNAMETMFAAADKKGFSGFIITSAYRSRADQEAIYAETTNGTAQTPGHSEHETGLCFDVGAVGYRYFDSAPEFEWITEHCAEYGFILRYPSGKEDVTGIPYEPWHYRYVGIDAATYIMENGITLEEYLKR